MISTAIKTSPLLAMVAILVLLAITATAQAQGLNNNAWSPGPQANRASIAALMKQVEDGNGSSSGTAFVGTGSGDVTQLICGSSNGESPAASSNAQANSSCIILNNSTGALNIDQSSEGDQSANAESTSTTTVDETINNAGGAEEVLDVLAGNS